MVRAAITPSRFRSAKLLSDDHGAFRESAHELHADLIEVIAAARREWDELPLDKRITRLREVREAPIHGPIHGQAGEATCAHG